MLATLTIFAVIVIIYNVCKSAFTKPYDPGSIDDVYKFQQDVQNPYVSSKQLKKNIRAGKYRKRR